jgi:hypothetical protein
MHKKTIRVLMAVITMIFCLGLAISPVLAANLGDAFKVSDGSNQDNLDSAAQKSGYDTTQTDILPFFSRLINIGLSFLGIVFLILMIYGGVLWMTDRGNESEVEKAKKLIQAAITGLIIVIASYAISWLVIYVLAQNTLKNS